MPKRRKKQTYAIGDVFFIRLDDGDVVPGQVIGQEGAALNSVTIALFDRKGPLEGIASQELDPDAIFSMLFVTRDLLDEGEWPVVAHRASMVPAERRPYEDLRGKGFIGARIRGSGNVESFVNAFYGLQLWDDWYDPNTLDDYLVSIDKKPVERLVFKRAR